MRRATRVRVPFVVFAACLAAGSVARAAERKELEQYEERFLHKWVERTARVQKSDRSRFLRELDAAFPGKVTDATSEQEYATWFDLLAGRNDQWWRDDAPTPQLAELFDRAIQRLEVGPVPSLTREEFAKYAKRVLREQNPSPGRETNTDEDADRVFRVLDRNGDDELDEEELTADLQDSRLFADADGDGRISKGEYRDSFRRRVAARVETLLASSSDAPRAAGNLPAAKGRGGLPEWFARLDADKDGQLSLYECRIGGGSVTLFAEMDLNGDGYLTRDELRRYIQMKDEQLNPKTRSKR